MDRARSCLLVASLILASKGTAARADDQQVTTDPFSWLEELQGKRSLDWVNAHTATTLAELTKAPEFPPCSPTSSVCSTRGRASPTRR